MNAISYSLCVILVFLSVKLEDLPNTFFSLNIYFNIPFWKGDKCMQTSMRQLRSLLNSLVGSTLTIATEYSQVSGCLTQVKYNYIVLSVGSDLLYIPLTSIKNIAY